MTLAPLNELPFQLDAAVLVLGLYYQFVVTNALILTFSPRRRDSDGMRLFMRLCVVRIQLRVH